MQRSIERRVEGVEGQSTVLAAEEAEAEAKGAEAEEEEAGVGTDEKRGV